jgi:hypothetical protein
VGELEGGRTKKNQMNQALYVKPYDAVPAGKGTHEIQTHGIPSPHNSPWPALSMDGAVAFNAHHRRYSRKLRRFGQK